MMTMPPTTSPFAVEVGDAAPQVVADLQVADVSQVDGLAVGLSRPTTRYSSLSRSSVLTTPRSWYSRLVTSIVRPPAS